MTWRGVGRDDAWWGRDDAGGFAVWGQPAAIEQTKLCCGLYGIIGIWEYRIVGPESIP